MHIAMRLIDRTVEAMAAGLVAIVAGLLIMNVFYREVLSWGLAWADEIPGLLLVWIAFLGAYLAYRRDGHIAFDMFVRALPQVSRTAIETLSDVAVLAFSLLMIRLSWIMIARVGGREIETLEISQGWFMTILPLAFGLIALALLARIAARFAGQPIAVGDDRPEHFDESEI